MSFFPMISFAFETDFHRFMEANHPQMSGAIDKEKDISPETEEALKTAIMEFKQSMASG